MRQRAVSGTGSADFPVAAVVAAARIRQAQAEQHTVQLSRQLLLLLQQHAILLALRGLELRQVRGEAADA